MPPIRIASSRRIVSRDGLENIQGTHQALVFILASIKMCMCKYIENKKIYAVLFLALFALTAKSANIKLPPKTSVLQ